MLYQANPVIVEAEEIVDVGPITAEGTRHLALRNGQNVTADAGMLARMTPVAADYWVKQADGYIYLNPKDVFERKYSPLDVDTVIDSQGNVHGKPIPNLSGLREAKGIY